MLTLHNEGYISGSHILYRTDVASPLFAGTVYLTACALALGMSSHRAMVLFSGVILAAAVIAYVMSERSRFHVDPARRRIVLYLTNGTQLPPTTGFRPDGDRAITLAAELLRRTLGTASPGASDTARLLIDAAKKVEAVKHLAKQEGLSLTKAKQRADTLSRDPSAG